MISAAGLIIIISSLGQESWCQESVAVCSCDLTVASCDVNCCCDADCSAADAQVFSRCDDVVLAADPKYCVAASLLFLNHTLSTAPPTALNDDGLLCIVGDRYRQRNFFVTPKAVETSEQFLELKSAMTTAEHLTLPLGQPENATLRANYSIGDAMLVADELQADVSELTLPRATLSTLCDGVAPVSAFEHTGASRTGVEGFLVSEDFSCQVPIGDVAVDCEENLQLSAATYSSGFSLLTSPKQAARGDISIVPRLYGTNAEASFNLSLPVFHAESGICSNVVTAVNYFVRVNASSGVADFAISLSYGSVSADDKELQLSFHVDFYLGERERRPQKLSGNPGYRIGEPVMAGRFVPEEDSIDVPDDRADWLTVTAANDCRDGAAQRTSVVFGRNMQSGCVLHLASDMSEEQCGALQATALAAIKGASVRDRVAGFANASTANPSDWTAVLLQNEPQLSATGGGGGVCPVVTGATYEILYAKTGSVAAPQPKIVGVMLRYSTPENVAVTCFEPQCHTRRRDTPHRLALVMTVTFVDVSRLPQPATALLPSIDISLPHDFFYPFTATSAASVVARPIASVLFLLAVFRYTAAIAG